MKATHHEQDHYTVSVLRYLLMPLLMELQNGLCALCHQPGELDIDHKRYGADVTLYDLQLLCVDCHCDKHPDVPVLRSVKRS